MARMLLFSKRVHLLLRVQVDADSVTFHDSSGRSFSFLLSRLLKRDATRMIDRLRTEIAARSTQ